MSASAQHAARPVARPDADKGGESARIQLENALNTLDERELRIIRLYFGLDGNEALTLEEIGDMMNLTRERIRQLKKSIRQAASSLAERNAACFNKRSVSVDSFNRPYL